MDSGTSFSGVQDADVALSVTFAQAAHFQCDKTISYQPPALDSEITNSNSKWVKLRVFENDGTPIRFRDRDDEHNIFGEDPTTERVSGGKQYSALTTAGARLVHKLNEASL
jgi:hypothetical protein